MANRAYGREHRVADFLQRELSALIRSELRDPRIGMITINEVRVTRDLAYADIYVSQLGHGELGQGERGRGEIADAPQTREDMLEALQGAGGLLRSLVAKSSTMRIVPRLRFKYDTALEYGMRMDRLIHDALASDRAAAADQSPAADQAPAADQGAAGDQAAAGDSLAAS